MSNGETNTRDQRVVGAYRAASAALDERPQAQTRAAILAAAARAVDAQPQDAATGATAKRAPRRQREFSGLRGPSRRPLAMVATFLVATVAVVLATRTNLELEKPASVADAVTMKVPEMSAPAEQQLELAHARTEPTAVLPGDMDSKREANGPTTSADTTRLAMMDKVEAAPPAPPVRGPNERPQSKPPTDRSAPAAPSRREVPPVQSQPPAPAKPAAPPTPATPTVPNAPPGPGAPSGPAKPSSGATSSTLPAKAAPAPAQEPAPQAAPERALIDADPPAQSSASGEARADDADNRLAALRSLSRGDAQRAAPAEAVASRDRFAKARPVERTVAMAERDVEQDPARWIERIVALRNGGYDDEADRELARLRERYPQHVVPPTALRRSGTR